MLRRFVNHVKKFALIYKGLLYRSVKLKGKMFIYLDFLAVFIKIISMTHDYHNDLDNGYISPVV